MNSYTVLATIPSLPAAVAQQASSVEASSIPVAANKALAIIMRREGVKGRHIDGLTLRITCNGRIEKK